MELYGENDSFMTYESASSCTRCQYILPALVDCAPSYFEKGFVVCEKCGEHVDLWQAVFGRGTGSSWIGLSLSSLGAAQTRTQLMMETGKYYEVDLAECGAPPDARVLHVAYNGGADASGLVTALEWQSHSARGLCRGLASSASSQCGFGERIQTHGHIS